METSCSDIVSKHCWRYSSHAESGYHLIILVVAYAQSLFEMISIHVEVMGFPSCADSDVVVLTHYFSKQ